MNLKVLFLLLLYYTILSSMFLLSDGLFTDNGFNSNININASNIDSAETSGVGLVAGSGFTRFIKFVGFGIGLPSDTPSWFSTLFALWQSLVTILSIGFIISSIWNG